MADIFTILQDFLCYGERNCIDYFSQYAYNPTEGIFYTVFFPIVFILIFIYIISRKLFPNHKGLYVLLSVAVFAFIILQGWYYWFITLGTMWYIALILLGFLWVALFGLRGGGGGGGGAQARAGPGGSLSGLGGKITKRMWDNISGREKALVDAIKADLSLLSQMSPNDVEVGRVSSRIYDQIQELYNLTQVGGVTVGRHYNEMLREYHNIMKKMKLRPKEGLPKSVKND